MTKGPRVDKGALLDAGLKLMEMSGKPLTGLPSRGTSKRYRMQDGTTVRLRTCNDHILIVVADAPSSDAHLNIEGTDWILLVMPEVPRTSGAVMAYLLPTHLVVGEARETHRDWLASQPKTRGENTTFNLWFSGDSSERAHGYDQKWARYRLLGHARTDGETGVDLIADPAPNLQATITAARKTISKVAGVPIEAVRVSIEFAS